MSDHTAPVLRELPSVDALLRTIEARRLCNQTGQARLTTLARSVIEELRTEVRRQASENMNHNGWRSREEFVAEATRRLGQAVESVKALALRRVINATGVILHTNLGRAPLSEAARLAVANEAAGYCTLEYDIRTGARGRRGARVEELLTELTGAEAALVVNNCAAATLLVLTALARDGETIVSRGELVEIGGDFRVPDVMAESGTHMVEVGTTNRTRADDYHRAVTERTRLILRVHPSNYRIVGFTATPKLAELAQLAHTSGLLLYEDAGSGALLRLQAFGLEGEPVIRESIAGGADIVSFSGDKLLGGAQAGLIVGRSKLIERLRRAPLYRALRADKLALAALEATLEAHARGASFTEVPTLRMLAEPLAQIQKRARIFARRLRRRSSSNLLQSEIIAGQSAIGGGSAPMTHPPTALIALSHPELTAAQLEQLLRATQPPVIARVVDDRVVLDLRTVAEDEESELLDTLIDLEEGVRSQESEGKTSITPFHSVS